MNLHARILLIDDNSSDRVLVIRELKREFPDIQVREIVDSKSLSQALSQHQFDLVITDYQLHWNDGITVLQMIKHRYPDCPVIMFTDSGDQEIAVKAMKAGLDDYVLKSPRHYIRLPAAVRSSLERVRDRHQAHQFKQRLQSLLNQLEVGVFRSTLDGQILEGNAAFLNMLNLKDIAAAQARNLYDTFWQPSRKAKMLHHLQQQEQLNRVEVCLHRHPETRWFLLSQALTKLEGETYVDGLLEDITERKQAELAVQQQTRREQLASVITQRIRQSLQLQDVLQTAVAEVHLLLQVDRVTIWQFQPNHTGIVVAEAAKTEWQMVSSAVIQQVWLRDQWPRYHQGQLQFIGDVQRLQLSDEIAELVRQYQIQSVLVAPILHQETVWGLLVVQQCSYCRYWQQTDGDLLNYLTNQLGIAIQQAELYQQVRQLNQVLECKVEERTAQLQKSLDFEALLKRITDKVRDRLDERHVLQSAVLELALALQADCCDASLYESSSFTATICYEYTVSLPSALGQVIPCIEHLNVYLQLYHGHHFQLCSNSMRGWAAILTCPIVDDESVLGDLWLFKPVSAYFDDLEVRLVQQVANQCAIAIRQSRLYQAAQNQVGELEQLNQLKDDFLNTVSHELRTPVANMKMATQMLNLLLNEDSGLSAESKVELAKSKVNHYIQILDTECTRELELINELLDLQRLDANDQPWEPVAIDLSSWFSYIINPFEERAQTHQQILEVQVEDGLPLLYTHPPSLERVITELVNNACKYTPPGEHITVSAMAHSDLIQMRVMNSGIEIPPQELSRVFDKFYRIPSADFWKQGGTGLGLTLVQKLVAYLGGSIQVESRFNQTCFIVELPSSQAG